MDKSAVGEAVGSIYAECFFLVLMPPLVCAGAYGLSSAKGEFGPIQAFIFCSNKVNQSTKGSKVTLRTHCMSEV